MKINSLVAGVTAFAFSLLVTATAYAYGYTNIAETSTKFVASAGLSTYSCAGCEGGSAKRVLTVSSSSSSWTEAGKWYVSNPPAYSSGRMDWKVFNPNPGGLRSAMRYGVYQDSGCGAGVECFEIVDDQSTGVGADAYLGYLSQGNIISFVMARNSCVPGYVCSRYIYYDTARYMQP